MLYGFYKWFVTRKLAYVPENFTVILKKGFILIFDSERSTRLERHIRIDEAGSLTNNNLPEAHLTLNIGLVNIRINKNTNNSKQELIEKLGDKVKITYINNENHKYRRHLEVENSLLNLYIQEYNAYKSNLLNELRNIELDLSKLSINIINCVDLESRWILLDEYKSKVLNFKLIEKELNIILDEVDTINTSTLIEKIYNKLQSDVANIEQPTNTVEPHLEAKDQETLHSLYPIEAKAQESLDSKEQVFILDAITEDNLEKAIEVVNDAPDYITPIQYLSIIENVRSFVLQNSARAIDRFTLQWISYVDLISNLEIIFDETLTTERKLLLLKQWQQSPCLQKAVKTFSSSFRKQDEVFGQISPMHFLAINNEIELFRLFLELGANIHDVGIQTESLELQLSYSLLLDFRIEEKFYVVFLEFYNQPFIQGFADILEIRFELARLNVRSNNLLNNMVENISILGSPLRLAVQKKFFKVIPIILTKNPSLTDVLIASARMLENGLIRYLEGVNFVDHHFIVLKTGDDVEVCTNNLVNNCRQFYENKNTQDIQNFLKFPKLSIIFHGYSNKNYNVITVLFSFLNERIDRLTQDEFWGIINCLIGSFDIKKDNSYTVVDAFCIAKASLYLCLINLQSKKIYVSLNFYKKLSLLMQKCVENLLYIIDNNLGQNLGETAPLLNIYNRFLLKIVKYNKETQTVSDAKQPLPAQNFKVQNNLPHLNLQDSKHSVDKKKRNKKKKNKKKRLGRKS